MKIKYIGKGSFKFRDLQIQFFSGVEVEVADSIVAQYGLLKKRNEHGAFIFQTVEEKSVVAPDSITLHGVNREARQKKLDEQTKVKIDLMKKGANLKSDDNALKVAEARKARKEAKEAEGEASEFPVKPVKRNTLPVAQSSTEASETTKKPSLRDRLPKKSK
jgi:hypothetical protein